MFDSIYFRCKECGEEIEAQSKSGDCTLQRYDHNSVPHSVAKDANRHAPFQCDKCKSMYEFEEVDYEERVMLKVKKL